MKGDQILSDYIDSSKDINANVMLTENEKVTFVFKAEEPYSASEKLSIVVVDPQNSEYTLEKDLSVSAFRGRGGALTETEYFLSFTPKISGVHHIKISNAYFQTDIELVSGMINPYEQPLFLITLFVSFIIMLTGLFSLWQEATIESIKSGNLSFNGILHFVLAISISLIIVHNVISLISS